MSRPLSNPSSLPGLRPASAYLASTARWLGARLSRAARCGGLSLIAAAAVGLGISTVASGAEPVADAASTPGWPSRPLRILVGFGPGSTPDLVARIVAEPLARSLGQPVVVENHAGASGNIAAALVAKATDQHTIGMLINGNMTIAKMLNPATAYEPQKDLQPLSLVCVAPMVLAVPATSAATSGASFLAAAKAAGNRWSYGSPGVGTLGHLGVEVFKARTGLAPVHVPYPGNPQVITGMVGGQIDLALLPPGLAQTQVDSGKLRAIGITAGQRSPLVPDMPTLAEAGLPALSLEIWTAAAAPSSLPAPIAQRLSRLIAEIVRTPDVGQKLFRQGYQAAGSTAAALGQRVQADTALLGEIIRTQHIVQE